jgi:hypothetical protein
MSSRTKKNVKHMLLPKSEELVIFISLVSFLLLKFSLNDFPDHSASNFMMIFFHLTYLSIHGLLLLQPTFCVRISLLCAIAKLRNVLYLIANVVNF